MNQIDVLLNSIAQKHCRVEVVCEAPAVSSEAMNVLSLREALMAAFQFGVQHGTNSLNKAPSLLFREVDIDLREAPARGAAASSCAYTPLLRQVVSRAGRLMLQRPAGG